jgi:hypothetical protein
LATQAIEHNASDRKYFAGILEDGGTAFDGVGSAEEGLAALELK